MILLIIMICLIDLSNAREVVSSLLGELQDISIGIEEYHVFFIE